MRLALSLGFAAFFALVQGCSNTGTTTTLDENAGDDTPGDSIEVPGGSGDQAEGDNSTPAPDQTGQPTNPEPPGPPAPPPKSKMTFFVTSTGSEEGGNLGGLDGADKKCQDLAAAVGGGDHTWHAYLSAQGVNAKDRIGPGPWLNQKGTVIAANVDALHAYNFNPPAAEMLDEKGAAIPPNAISILTGTKQDGTALPQTCNNWTSSQGNQQGRVGDAAAQGSVILGAHWNDSTKSYGCSQNAITQNKGQGRLYCFAID